LPLFRTDVFEADVMENAKVAEKIGCGRSILVAMTSEGAIRMVPIDVTMMTTPLSIDIGREFPSFRKGHHPLVYK